MPFPNEHAARIKDPGSFEPESFRRKNVAPGVDIIVGKLKGEDSTTAQTYRFDKTKFTPDEARKWLKDHDISTISFEPAQESKDMGEKIPGVPDGTGPLSGTPLCAMNKEDDEDEKDDEEWVTAFRAGTHTDSAGDTQSWSAADMVKIADRYNQASSSNNPERHVAPVVIGHPASDSPAYGWVEKAKAVGDKLMLKLGQLQPAFVDALKTGLYKTRSISLYPDMTIRHLGFLGAAPPAVKGLGPFKFAEEKPFHTYEFAEGDAMDDVNELKAKVRWYDKLFSIFQIDTGKLKNFEEGVAMSDKKVDTAVAPVETKVAPVVDFSEENKTLKAENEALKKQITEKAETAKVSGYKAFCDALVTDGKLRPTDVDQTVINMQARAALDKVSNFAETDEKSSIAIYKAYLNAMPKVVEFKELVTGKAPDGKTTVSNFVEEEISKLMKVEPALQYHQALDKVASEHPDKVREYVDASYIN